MFVNSFFYITLGLANVIFVPKTKTFISHQSSILMDDFSFSFSHLENLFLLVKTWMKFDTLDGDCSLPPHIYLKSIEIWYVDGGRNLRAININQEPLYSKNKLQSQLVTFRRHLSDKYIHFFLSVFSISASTSPFLSFLLYLFFLWPPPSFYFILFLLICFFLGKSFEKLSRFEEVFLK